MSRILEKAEFIILLKDIVNKLDKNNIRNEIPFVYKNKMTYDFIKIIIPEEINEVILEDIFKSNEYSVKDEFIDFYYKDFRIVFIRTPESSFFASFFYYSWDIMSTLMNIMLNKFGLNLTPIGLKYSNCNNPFLISSNIKNVFEFLELNFNDYLSGSFNNGVKKINIVNKKGDIIEAEGLNYGNTGFNSLEDEIKYISTSYYFNINIFKNFELDKNDFFYFEKKPYYDYIQNILKMVNNEDIYEYEYVDNLDDYLLKINTMFPDSKFLEILLKNKNYI